MARTVKPWHLLVAVLGAVALVATACSAGSGVTVIADQGEDEPVDEPAASGDVSALCELARSAEETFADLDFDLGEDLGPVADRIRQVYDDLIAAAPDDLRDDLANVRDVSIEVLDRLAEFDLSDPDLDLDSLSDIEASLEQIQGSVSRVETVLRDDCGIDLGLDASGVVEPGIDFDPGPLGDPDLDLFDLEGDGDSDLGGGVEGLPDTLGDDERLDVLWISCDEGDLDACDDLYIQSPIDSAYELFGSTCGDRLADETFGQCVSELGEGDEQDLDLPVDGPSAFGDDAGLDVLWIACDEGVYDACDDLYLASPVNSGYELFGSTCGGRNEDTFGGCAFDYTADEGLDFEAEAFGDDPGNDALLAACDGGNMVACDLLFFRSAFGSEYEARAQTCGGLREADFGGDCAASF